jgi:hypothetical protein
MPDGSLRWSFILFAQRGDQAYQVVWDEMVSLPASLPLGGPKDAATAAVVSTYSRMSPTDQTISSSGALALTFSAGKVAGTVQGLPTVLDASFVADLRVECLVPPDAAAADGAHGNGPVHSVVDAAMADPGCAPMRALR